MDNTDMSAEAITFRLKKVSQLRKLCVALRKGGSEKQPLEKNDYRVSLNEKSIEFVN